MPLIQVSMLAGRDAETRQALIEKLTQATVDALGSNPESVTVILTDVDRDNWAKGGVPMSVRKPG